MDRARLLENKFFVVFALAVLALWGQAAYATTVTFDLVCVLNGNVCNNPVPTFGTVTLNDAVGGGDISVTVDLVGTGQKFRDLMLNFDFVLGGITGITSISSTDGQVSLVSNGFQITPYGGLFDVGQNDAQGWEGSDLYSTVLSSNGATVLTLAMFNTFDSLGKVNVGVHIQSIGDGSGGNCSGAGDGTTNCVPGNVGVGSLKIGGLEGGPPQEIPEPATTALMGGGLLALAWALRRRKQA